MDTGAPADDLYLLPIEGYSFNANMAMLPFQGQPQLIDFELDLTQSQVDGPHLADANIVLGSGSGFNDLPVPLFSLPLYPDRWLLLRRSPQCL